MSVDQLTIPGLPTGGAVDADTASLLALIDMDPVHARDREIVVRAIVEAGHAAGGRVDPNVVRGLIDGRVNPRVVGPTYAALRHRKALTWDGKYVVSDDVTGGNAGKPARTYLLNVEHLTDRDIPAKETTR